MQANFLSVSKDTRDHPFKTSAFFREGGVKNWSNLPTDSSKILPMEGGGGQKFADVLNGWSILTGLASK